MSKLFKLITIFIILTLLFSAVLPADVAEAKFKDHECKGKSCEPRAGQSRKCEGPSRRTNPHC
jgi:hypothetical protein